MTDRDAFLRAIAADPDDDAPRLVFADWLDERTGRKAAADREWAAVIRRDIDIARLPRTDPRSWSVRANPQPKMPTIARMLLPAKARQFAVLNRGFADTLAMSFRKFDVVIPHLAGCPAPLRKLILSQGGRSLASLVSRPELMLFRELAFYEVNTRDAGATAIAECPHLANLSRLQIGNAVGLAGVRAVVHSPHLANVRELNLGRGIYGDEGLAVVADSPMAERLERLTQYDNSSAGLARLAASPRLGRLQNLAARCDDDEYLRPITAGGLPALNDLHVGCLGRAGGALAEFLRSPRFAALRSLTLWGGIPASVWTGLSADPGPPSLRLWYEATEPGAVAAFVRSPALGRCVDLELRGRGMSSADVEALATSPYAAGLRYLKLPDMPSGGDSVPVRTLEALAASPQLSGLVGLYLGGFEPDDDGIDALCDATFADSLRALSWWGNRVSVGKVVERFVNRPAFPALVAIRPATDFVAKSPYDMLSARYPGGRYDW